MEDGKDHEVLREIGDLVNSEYERYCRTLRWSSRASRGFTGAFNYGYRAAFVFFVCDPG